MSGEGGSQLPSSTSGQARPREGFLEQACWGLTTVNMAGNRRETWDINLTLFLFSVKTQTPRETQHMEWEKIFLNHTSENRLASIIHKELLQVNKNKAIQKSAKDLKGWVSRADTQTAQHVRRCSGHILGETELKVSRYCPSRPLGQTRKEVRNAADTRQPCARLSAMGSRAAAVYKLLTQTQGPPRMWSSHPAWSPGN